MNIQSKIDSMNWALASRNCHADSACRFEVGTDAHTFHMDKMYFFHREYQNLADEVTKHFLSESLSNLHQSKVTAVNH